jgi:hypothetical protein
MIDKIMETEKSEWRKGYDSGFASGIESRKKEMKIGSAVIEFIKLLKSLEEYENESNPLQIKMK